MIGNDYLNKLFAYPDEDTAINQLLEFLASCDEEFLASLYENVDLNECSPEELTYLTKVSALIDYMLQLNELEIPDWIRDERLVFDKPYYHSKRITDFEKVRMIYTSPGPFRARNVFFDLNGIRRV